MGTQARPYFLRKVIVLLKTNNISLRCMNGMALVALRDFMTTAREGILKDLQLDTIPDKSMSNRGKRISRELRKITEHNDMSSPHYKPPEPNAKRRGAGDYELIATRLQYSNVFPTQVEQLFLVRTAHLLRTV